MKTLYPINKVTTAMGLTGRTLRYWEAAGLFQSQRDSQSGWRCYDEEALMHIRLTDLLRRMEISIKDIGYVLQSKKAAALKEVLLKKERQLKQASRGLKHQQQIIQSVMKLLENQLFLPLPAMEALLISLAPPRKKQSLDEMLGGNEMENEKSLIEQVKIIKLPPMRGAAFIHVGAEPEEEARLPVTNWIKKMGLEGTMQLFGFNADPYPSADSQEYGFGYCATIPTDVDIPKPLFEMHLPGGLYGVISDYEGDPSFGWQKAMKLLEDAAWPWELDTERLPGLEEHLDRGDKKGGYQDFYISILFPIKPKA